MNVDLSKFDNSWYSPGRNFFIRSAWFLVNALFFQNSLNPSSRLKYFLLRLFGTKIGKGVVLKPSINVKYPWNLEIGDNSWIGEQVWLDSLDKITIGKNVCISQGAYLCTGNHDWSDPAFRLMVKPIIIHDGAWLGSQTNVAPGVIIGEGSVLTMGSTALNNLEPWQIYQGNPAKAIGNRKIDSVLK